METSLVQKLAESGATFALLGYVVWAIVGLLRSTVEAAVRMAEQLAKSNADLANLLREQERARIEERQIHAEQTILLKMTLDKISENRHG